MGKPSKAPDIEKAESDVDVYIKISSPRIAAGKNLFLCRGGLYENGYIFSVCGCLRKSFG